jgi:O-antigen/teichoic acid export membrane protein
VLVVLLLGHLVNGTLGLTGWVITMGGRSRLILLNNLVSATSNVVLCCLLIPRMGLLGAALSSASSVALLQTIQLVEVALLYRVHPFSRGFFKALAAGAVVLLLAEFALGALDLPTVARLLLRGFVILAGYGLMLVGLGLAVEERDLARKFWRRVFG